MMPRLTRKEKQAHTRACLMQSAATVFARRGLQQASIDEVAEDAGYTKGAFYANFKSKEELFLAMLDERFTQRIEGIESVIAGEGSTAEKARRAGDNFVQGLSADREWERLFFEFSAYAARDDDFREELVTRYRTMRDRMAAALESSLRGARQGGDASIRPGGADGVGDGQRVCPGEAARGRRRSGRALRDHADGVLCRARGARRRAVERFGCVSSGQAAGGCSRPASLSAISRSSIRSCPQNSSPSKASTGTPQWPRSLSAVVFASTRARRRRS